MPNFTTGPATLPDVGTLSYNGCTFSSLFETSVSGTVVKDTAGRTTKYMDYVITADGYVTLLSGAVNIETSAQQMSELLSAQGGVLQYSGRGLKLNVGGKGSPVQDVAWGPSTELHEFQPLGGGRSAKCKITIRTRVLQGQIAFLGLKRIVLEFTQEIGVAYNEDGYSSLSIRGTLEIALTRVAQSVHTLTTTVDDLRGAYMTQLAQSIDLNRFRVVKRNFNTSRDRRTMDWDFLAEELPYMQMPSDCTLAYGSYNVRPAKQGMGLCTWFCTLTATYTVRKDAARRTAWLAFLALLRLRMSASQFANIPQDLQNQAQQNLANNPLINPVVGLQGLFRVLAGAGVIGPAPAPNGAGVAARILAAQNAGIAQGRRAFLIDFNFNEGVYLDSKKVTFTATWKLITTFSHILLASGLWKKLPERNPAGNNLWAASAQGISGPYSWLQNRIDASQDVIVDFGNPGVS